MGNFGTAQKEGDRVTAKKDNEEASHAADPALEQGRAAGEDAEKKPDPEPEEEEAKVDEENEDSFPSSDAPSW